MGENFLLSFCHTYFFLFSSVVTRFLVPIFCKLFFFLQGIFSFSSLFQMFPPSGCVQLSTCRWRVKLSAVQRAAACRRLRRQLMRFWNANLLGSDRWTVTPKGSREPERETNVNTWKWAKGVDSLKKLHLFLCVFPCSPTQRVTLTADRPPAAERSWKDAAKNK